MDFVEPDGVLGVHVVVSESAPAKPETVSNVSPILEFNTFYEQEFSATARFAWFLVRSPAAEDLAQEAFIALNARWSEIDNPRGFVHRVVVNRSRSWQRDERRRRAKVARLHHDQSLLSPSDADLFDLIVALPY